MERYSKRICRTAVLSLSSGWCEARSPARYVIE